MICSSKPLQNPKLINLFDEHKDAGHFTVDQAIEEVEELVTAVRENRK